MVVHVHRQAIATFETAVFQYFSSVCSSHPGPEAMDTESSAYFGLISSFWHLYFPGYWCNLQNLTQSYESAHEDS